MWQTVKEYIQKKYRIEPDFPFREDMDTAVFRHQDNRRWFALVMDVTASKLGLSKEARLPVILLRQDGIFPAYHMNKMHWITVLLDGRVEKERVLDLIDASFLASASPKKKGKLRPAKEWIVPANPKYYDIQHAFDERKEIDWKQGAGIRTGDTVYLYVAAPVSAVLYQCKVTRTGIPYHFESEHLTITALMKLRLQKRFAADAFPFERLRKEFGITAVRGPRTVPHSLSSALAKAKPAEPVRQKA